MGRRVQKREQQVQATQAALAAAEENRTTRYVKTIKPHNPRQRFLLQHIDSKSVTFAIGPAGTGKTYLAVAKAVEALNSGEVSRIILSRPAVEAGGSLGFLPGGLKEKMDPYMRPLYDVLQERMDPRRITHLMEQGTIEIAPLGFMRGRTLNNAFIVLDEGQNATFMQMKMFLTRLGFNSKMVVTGDPDQVDLEPAHTSGLARMVSMLEGKTENVGFTRFLDCDVVRHPLIAEILPLMGERPATGAKDTAEAA